MQDVTSILKEINLTHVIISLIMYLFSILSLTRQRIGKHRVDLKKSSHYDAIAHTPLTEGGHSHHLLVHAILCIKSTSHCSFTHPTATTTCSPAQPPPRREVSNGLLTRPTTSQEGGLKWLAHPPHERWSLFHGGWVGEQACFLVGNN